MNRQTTSEDPIGYNYRSAIAIENKYHFMFHGTIKIFLITALFSTLTLTYLIVGAQVLEGTIPPTPRQKENHEKPGYYQMVVLPDKRVLNKGDEINIDLYFTGYGEIGLSKVYISVSSDIFDRENSIFRTSLDQKGRVMSWGASSGTITPLTVVNLNGGIQFLKNDTVKYFTQYIDMKPDFGDLNILTEYRFTYAPLSFHLKLREDVEPSNYIISFYYTYYNGMEWKGSTSEVPLKVNSLFEKYTDILIISGWVFALIAIFPVLSATGEFIYNFYSKQYKKWRLKIKNKKPILPKAKSK